MWLRMVMVNINLDHPQSWLCWLSIFLDDIDLDHLQSWLCWLRILFWHKVKGMQLRMVMVDIDTGLNCNCINWEPYFDTGWEVSNWGWWWPISTWIIFNHNYVDWESYFDSGWDIALRMVLIDIVLNHPILQLPRLRIQFWQRMRCMWLGIVMVNINLVHPQSWLCQLSILFQHRVRDMRLIMVMTNIILDHSRLVVIAI